MSQCTWKDPDKPKCSAQALHLQVDNAGKPWANLCTEHHNLMEGSVGVNVKNMLSYWIRAQGMRLGGRG